MVDNLLVMGELTDDDLIYVLRLIDPESFDDNYIPGMKQAAALSYPCNL